MYAINSEVNARKGVWAITDNSAATRAVIVCSYLFVCSFAITMGPVSWTYPAELVRFVQINVQLGRILIFL